MEKYLMTFQNFISRIPKWNPSIIENETKRMREKSGCVYLEDLITCVHIIQLKILTAMRVGQKQKKIDINIPKLDDFIHKVYINGARKLYKNIYLFEIKVTPLQAQKNNREIEILIQESILNTIRESIPVENILKAYMDETVEEDVVEEVKEEIIEEPKPENSAQTGLDNKAIGVDATNNVTNNESSANNVSNGNSSASIKFNDIDYVKDDNDTVTSVVVSKDIENLEKISESRSSRDDDEDDDEDDVKNERLNISNQDVTLDSLDIHTLNEPKLELLPELLIDDIEVLT